jgi:transposase
VAPSKKWSKRERELKARVAALEGQLQAALKALEEARQRIADLERQLKQDSSNSDKPPSSDPPHRPPRKKPGKGKRKPGGQPGHEGKTRPLLPPEQVDDIQDHKPSTCDDCGAKLTGEDSSPLRHQVTEVPPVAPTVIEHRLHSLQCGCGATTQAGLPSGVPSGAFGPRLTALVGLMTGAYRVSKRNTQQLLLDCFGVRISLGSIKSVEDNLSDALAGCVEEAADYVQSEATSVGMDETSWRVRGQKAWLWTAVTTLVVVFAIRFSRGSDVAKEILGHGYDGHLVSDRWSGYVWYSAERRQVCWSHLKRDFEKLVEAGGQIGTLGSNLQEKRRRLFRWWHRVRDGTLSRAAFQANVKPLRAEVADLLRQAAACKDEHAKLAGMAKEILKLEQGMWTFVEHPGVEPTNNAAERALRHAVIWRKTSFGTQSARGTVFVERMLTVVTSLRLQGRSVLEFLAESTAAALTGAVPPSLLPEVVEEMGCAA